MSNLADEEVGIGLDRLAPLLGGFSHPAEDLSRPLFDLLTDGWVYDRVQALLELGAAPAGSVHYLRASVQTPTSGVADGPGDWAFVDHFPCRVAERAATAACLALTAAFFPGSWEIQLASPARFRCHDVLLPPTGRLAGDVTSDGYSLRIGDRVVARRSHDRWVHLDPSVDRLPTVHGHSLPCYTRDYASAVDLEAVPDEFRPRLIGSSVAVLDDMFRLLADHAPQHLAWIERVTTTVALHSARPGWRESGSAPAHLGLIRISADPAPAALAEMMVHEASHQHLYLVSRLGPLLHNPSQLRYSPLKGTSRPLEKLLLGFHAFGNISSLLMTLRDAPLARRYVEAEWPAVNEQSRILWSALQEDADLSALGQALTRPLADRLGL